MKKFLPIFGLLSLNLSFLRNCGLVRIKRIIDRDFQSIWVKEETLEMTAYFLLIRYLALMKK